MGYSIHPNDPAARAQDFERAINADVECRGIMGRLFGHKVRRVRVTGTGTVQHGIFITGHQVDSYETKCVRCGLTLRDSRSGDPGYYQSPYSAPTKRRYI